MEANPDRPQLTDFLEMQRRVSRVFFQKQKVLLGNLLDGAWEFVKEILETPRCSMHLKVLQLALAFLVQSFFN
jgi:hypothetical protein